MPEEMIPSLSTYTRTQRRMDSFFIVVFLILFYLSGKHLWQSQVGVEHPLVGFMIASFLGFLASDFAAGSIHWFADTWGRPDWPIVGNSLIRTFREHHIDPLAITRHDFVETNGATFMGGIPFLLASLFIEAEEGTLPFFYSSFFFAMTLFGAPTSQIHKWAHQDKVPGWVKQMQKVGVFLSKGAHDRHHVAPFSGNYCITSGQMNPILDRLKFFRIMESIISRVTGMQPREDDRLQFSLLHSASKSDE